MHVPSGKNVWLILASLFICLVWARTGAGLQPEAPDDGASHERALVLDVDGPIGPATAEFITRAIERASETGAALVVVTHDPGVTHDCDRRLHLVDGRLAPA